MVSISWRNRDSLVEITEANQSEGMGSRTARGGVIAIGASFAKAIIQLLMGVVLSRLLSLDDFGVVVMAGTFIAFLSMFSDLGMGGATVQRLKVDHGLLSALFWIGCSVGVGLFLLCCALAPAVALLYRDDRLIQIVIAAALVIPLTSLGSQHQAIMTRQARWLEIQLIIVVSQLLSSLLAVYAAWAWSFGYWALPLQSVSAALFTTLCFWTLCRWRPGWPEAWQEARSAVHFGGYVMLFNAVNYAHRQMDNVIVGRTLGAAQLGLYFRGYALFMLPLTMIVWPIGTAVAPLLARQQEHPDRFAATYYSALAVVYAISAPVAGGLFLFATEGITLLYGAKWVESAEVLSILAIAILWQPAYTSGGWIDMSLGRSKRHFHASLIAAAVYLTAFLIGAQYGIAGVAKAYLAANCLVVPPWVWWTSRGTLINWFGIMKACRGSVVALVLAVFLTWQLSPHIGGDWYVNLFVRAFLYGIVYLAVGVAFLKFDRGWAQLLLSAAGKLRSGS